jgi:hypothetical protein
MNNTRTPVIFIHDLWLHPASWQPWLDLFQDAGYASAALASPGVPATVELARAHAGSRTGYGIDDLAEFADRGHSLTIDAGWRAKQLRNRA